MNATSPPVLPRDAYTESVRHIEPTIEPLFEKLGDLCTLPALATQIIQVAEDQNSNSDDLLTVIEQDPAVAMRLMKVVNSSYSGVRHEVADLKMAITLLGTQQVRNLALAVSVGAVFNRVTPVGKIDPVKLWDHSVCVATACRLVAKKTGYAPPEEAYLAGLLHDLGLVFIVQHLGNLIPRVLARVSAGRDLCEAEREVFAFDHAQIGAYVAWRSSSPMRLVSAIDYHHSLFGCPPEGLRLAQTVHIADYLATRYGRGAIEGHRLPAPSEGVLLPMGLTLPDLRGLWDDLPESLADVRELTRV